MPFSVSGYVLNFLQFATPAEKLTQHFNADILCRDNISQHAGVKKIADPNA